MADPKDDAELFALLKSVSPEVVTVADGWVFMFPKEALQNLLNNTTNDEKIIIFVKHSRTEVLN